MEVFLPNSWRVESHSLSIVIRSGARTLVRMDTNEHTIIKPVERAAYSMDEFAIAHRISRTVAYGEVKAGRLTARKVGGRTIVTIEDAAAWRESLPRASPDK